MTDSAVIKKGLYLRKDGEAGFKSDIKFGVELVADWDGKYF